METLSQVDPQDAGAWHKPTHIRKQAQIGNNRFKYIVVTAVRNEEKYLPYSTTSILNQSIDPSIYVVVNDGSNDESANYLKKLPVFTLNLHVPRIPVRGVNQSFAINKGVEYASIFCPDWKYLLKTDADVVLPSSYVECLMEMMESNPKLGICGGWPLNNSGRKMKVRLNRTTDAARLYRRKCWDEIGGLDTINAFDTHAILKSRQKGWETTIIPYLNYKELRSSVKNNLNRWIQSGFCRKSFGFPLWHSVFAALKNIKSGRPPILGPLTMIISHLFSRWPSAPQLDTRWMKKFSVWEIKEFSKELFSSRPGKSYSGVV